jgi:hypothetical protein
MAAARLQQQQQQQQQQRQRQRRREVGCYWYPAEVSWQPLTRRNLTTVPANTCTYFDLGNLLLFNVTAEGTLNRAAPQAEAHAAQIVADIAALKVMHKAAGQPYAVKALYEIWDVTPAYGDQPSGHLFCDIFANASLNDRYSTELAQWCADNRRGCDGFNVDWEVTLTVEQADAKRGLTAFLRQLKQKSRALGHEVQISMDTGSLTGLLNIAEVGAIQPYVDKLEFMSYWTNLTSNLSLAASNDLYGSIDHNIAILLRNYRYAAWQIIIGVGLSAESVTNGTHGVERAAVPGCAYWGWGCGPAANGPHASTELGSRRWDELAADVAAGRAERIELDPVHGGGHVYFFPKCTNSSRDGQDEVGEVAWFNTLDDVDIFTEFVTTRGLGGVFSWIATSDSLEWTVHKRLHRGVINS